MSDSTPTRPDLEAWSKGEVAWVKIHDLILYIRHQDAEIQRITRERDAAKRAAAELIKINGESHRKRDRALEQIERLKAENAELVKDRERLDWLEHNVSEVRSCGNIRVTRALIDSARAGLEPAAPEDSPKGGE